MSLVDSCATEYEPAQRRRLRGIGEVMLIAEAQWLASVRLSACPDSPS